MFKYSTELRYLVSKAPTAYVFVFGEAGNVWPDFSDFDYYASKGAEGVDFRAKNMEAINNLEKNSIDFYASVKSLYLQDRRKKILNSDDITDTQDDSDWEEIETQ